MATEKIWTLFLDESGSFDDAERVAYVVGGVLCPGHRPDLDAKRVFLKACGAERIAYPPHATLLQSEVRLRLLDAAAKVVRSARGRWVFMSSRPSDRAANAVTAYVQMLGALVDAVARRVALDGCQQLVVVAAQRTTPMTPDEVREAMRAGLGRIEGQFEDGERVPFRAWVEGEVRQVFDALAREDPGVLPARPGLLEVHVVSATGSGVDAGVAFADAGCNHLLRLLAGRVEGLAPIDRADLMVLDRNEVAFLRRIDRRLRESPPDLHGAARALATLSARHRAGASGALRLPAGSTAAAGYECFTQSCDRLEGRPDSHGRTAHALAGAAFAALASKMGDYEGTWLALEYGWSGPGALARRMREGVEDRELAARLWRCVLECANHRGDFSTATRAVAEFDAIVARGQSLMLLAERLSVRNSTAVAAQNRLPATPETCEAIRAELRTAASLLRDAATDAGTLVALAGESGAKEKAPDVTLAPAEVALWGALGKEPAFGPPDAERGRLLGTAARSLAFAGDLDTALALALEARAFFAEPHDRRINAANLGRMLAEKGRMEGASAVMPGLRAALELAGVTALQPGPLVKRLEADPSLRFGLDLLLRALLWAPDAVGSRDTSEEALDPRGALYRALAALRSHPTELVARHAGELVRVARGHDVAVPWFVLSLELSAEAEKGSVLRRFSDFTRRLAADPPLPREGPPGSLLNPTFEYR